MKRILFVIHDLGHGGAEKVLVNLVNHMDPQKFDITVLALFGGGVNEQFLKPHIHLQTIFKKPFPGNSQIMKLLTPKQLHKAFIKEKYDVEISYLEGPSARIVSGCPNPETKLISWIHVEQHTAQTASHAFRSYHESAACYMRFDRTICVSEAVKQDFSKIYPDVTNITVLYNTNETAQILSLKGQTVPNGIFRKNEIRLCGVGKIMPMKGFDRLARIHKRLTDDGYPVHTYILGEGAEQGKIETYLNENNLSESFTFLGYQTNPYKYVSKCDLFVCSSHAEGFSTAATEALIVGTPVVTTLVAGMKEMLGENNEYGIVTENNEQALYEGIKRMLDDPERLKHYHKQAELRGRDFSTENTVKAAEKLLDAL